MNIHILRMSNRVRTRSSQGQAIAEGAAMMPVIIGLAVAMVMLIIFSGTAFYYWIQLSSVSTQLATYLATQVTSDETALTDAQKTDLISKANAMLDVLNLPKVASDGTGSMTLATNLSKAPAIAVSLTLSGLKLFGGTVPTLNITGTGVGLEGAFEPKFKYFSILTGMCKKSFGYFFIDNVYVPCYKVTTKYDSTGSLPRGLTHLRGWGVNCTEESSPDNCWDEGSWGETTQ